MKQTTAYYSLDHKIKDTRFSIDFLQDYSLLLQAGEHEFQLAVVDTKSNRCLLLEHYNLLNYKNQEEYQQLIKDLFEAHTLLMAGFWHSVRFSIKNTRFSLVPTALFDIEQLPAYLRLTSPQQQNDKFQFYMHKKHKLVNAFAAEQGMLEWLNARYPNLKVAVLHHISAFIEGVLDQPIENEQPGLYLLREQGMLSIVMARQGKLMYANIFRCKAPADMLRYLMMLVKQFGLNQSQVPLRLWGNADAKSAWHKEIAPYFSNISFGKRPRQLIFSYMFDEVPEQRFFDLFSQQLCE